jgi:hypothetical protein
MGTNRRIILLFFIITTFLALTAVQVAAQSETNEPEVCAQIVENAFEQVSQVCAGYDLGQICIGHGGATAAFAQEVDEDFFTQPGDSADLSLIQAATTSPMDVEEESWGLAVVNVQANLPTEVVEDLDDKGVIYFVFGGMEISEATAEDDILIPLAEGIPVTTIATADMRQSPNALDGDLSNVIGRIPEETTLNADAISADEEWVRIVFEGQPGWISRNVIPAAEDLSTLVEISPDNFTAMQSIDIALNGNNGPCVATEQGVMVHGPDDIPVDIEVNGVHIQVDSTIFVMPLPDNRIRIFTFSGMGIVYPLDATRTTFIPPGFFADIDLATGEFVTPDPFPGTNIAPFGGPDLIQFLNNISQDFPTNLTHYTPEELQIISPSGVGDTEWFIIYINVQNVNLVQEFCTAGLLTENVCEVYIT